jgi:hypothetical protein
MKLLGVLVALFYELVSYFETIELVVMHVVFHPQFDAISETQGVQPFGIQIWFDMLRTHPIFLFGRHAA